MTVAELIEKLKELPLDAPVEMYTYDDYHDEPVMWMDVEGVGFSPETNTVQISY